MGGVSWRTSSQSSSGCGVSVFVRPDERIWQHGIYVFVGFGMFTSASTPKDTERRHKTEICPKLLIRCEQVVETGGSYEHMVVGVLSLRDCNN